MYSIEEAESRSQKSHKSYQSYGSQQEGITETQVKKKFSIIHEEENEEDCEVEDNPTIIDSRLIDLENDANKDNINVETKENTLISLICNKSYMIFFTIIFSIKIEFTVLILLAN